MHEGTSTLNAPAAVDRTGMAAAEPSKQTIAELAEAYDREHHDRLVEVLHTQLANCDPLLQQRVHDANARAQDAAASLEALAAQAAQAAEDEAARAARASRLLAKAEAERAAAEAERDAARTDAAQEIAAVVAGHEAALAALRSEHAAALEALRGEVARGADAVLEATAAEQAAQAAAAQAREDAASATREADDVRAQLDSATANLQQLLATQLAQSEDSSRMTDAIQAAEFDRQRALADSHALQREHDATRVAAAERDREARAVAEQLAALREEFRALQERLRASEADAAAVRAEFESADARHAGERNALDRELRAAGDAAERAATQASREIGRIQHAHSKTKLSALQQRQRLESRLADVEARRAAVEEELEAAERARREASEARDALAPDAEAAAGLRVARRALEQRLLTAQDAAEASTDRAVAAEHRVRGLEEKVAAATREAADAVAAREATAGAAKERLGALEKTLQEVCCETDGLKSEVEMYRARADSCEQVEALATGLQQAKLSLERQIAELRAGLRKAQAALAAAEPAAARVPGLEAELRVAREEGAAAEARLRDLAEQQAAAADGTDGAAADGSPRSPPARSPVQSALEEEVKRQLLQATEENAVLRAKLASANEARAQLARELEARPPRSTSPEHRLEHNQQQLTLAIDALERRKQEVLQLREQLQLAQSGRGECASCAELRGRLMDLTRRLAAYDRDGTLAPPAAQGGPLVTTPVRTERPVPQRSRFEEYVKLTEANRELVDKVRTLQHAKDRLERRVLGGSAPGRRRRGGGDDPAGDAVRVSAAAAAAARSDRRRGGGGAQGGRRKQPPHHLPTIRTASPAGMRAPLPPGHGMMNNYRMRGSIGYG